MLVVFAGKGRFRAFLANDAELFCMKRSQISLLQDGHQGRCGGIDLPGLSCACHSLSLLCTGCDMFRVSAVENRAPRNGIVGIDARRAKVGRIAAVAFNVDGVARRVVLLKA